jgi:Kdo2-lipid IVA lauroyltransferase/acyltransferase
MYYIVYPLLYALSLLPWFIIYVISDAFYVLAYYIIGYRKKVVRGNLAIAFPEKTVAERLRIEKDFYHQLIDSFIEMIKLISISKAELNKRFICDYSLVQQIERSGQKLQFHGGHFFNWEFVNLAFSANAPMPFIGVYMPISNKVMDKIFYNYRAKFGTILIPAPKFKYEFPKHSHQQYSMALAADQSAGNPNNGYWLPFFGKLTPFVTGPEKGAKLNNTAILFTTYYKIKRGFYQCEFSLYTTAPNTLPEGKITKDYRDFVEDQIRQRPSNFLWSHKRWKHQYDEAKFGHLRVE